MHWVHLYVTHLWIPEGAKRKPSSGTRLPLEVWRHISQIHLHSYLASSKEEAYLLVDSIYHSHAAAEMCKKSVTERKLLPRGSGRLCHRLEVHRDVWKQNPSLKCQELKTAIGCSPFPRCHSDWADICSEHNTLCSPSAFLTTEQSPYIIPWKMWSALLSSPSRWRWVSSGDLKEKLCLCCHLCW